MVGLLIMCLVTFQSLFGNDMPFQHPQGAGFKQGLVTPANSFMIGPLGGLFEIDPPDKTIEHIYLDVPPNAVSRETHFSVSFDSGTFVPVIGEASGYVMIIDTGNVRTFQQAIKVIVQRQPPRYRGIPVGYSIEDDGKIKGIDTVWDKESGKLTFYSFRPLRFTWVYTKA